MKNTQYLALLRGINVGGKNIIKITDLKAGFDMTIRNWNTTTKLLELLEGQND